MTTSELAGTISACIDSSGTLTLAGDALGSTTMAAVFATCLTNGTLIIDGASVTTTGEDVTVTGNGTDRFAALAVTAVFVPLESGDVQATVTGVTTAGWTFSTAFSSLSGGIYDEVPVAAGGSLALRTLADGDFPAGFWFAGSLEVAGALAEISYFLGEHTTLAVLGAITVTYGIPEFHFGAAAGLGVTVGTLSGLDFTLNANCAPLQGGATDTATQDAYLSLSTSLSFSAKGAPETVSASMRCGTGADAQIILVATLDSNPGVLLDDFLDWAGTSLSVGMPDPSLFDPSNDLTVSGISFTIVQSTGEMVSFDLTVSTTDAWGIIPDLIAVTDVSLTLTSSSPAKNPSVSGAIHGTVLLGDDGDVAQIDVQGTAPDYVISGKLAEGCEVDVSALAALLIPAAIGIPSIQLTNFDFTCQDSAAPYYNVEADFQSDWNLDLSVVGLAITGASIKFDYGSPAGTGTASGTASGSISGTIVLNDDISFDITYDIPGEFKIAGAIATISLTALVARLVDMVMTLPAGFDLTLSNSSVLIVYGNDGATLEFQVGTQIDGLGSVVFEALKVGTNWGYALGLSLGSVRLSDVPGLSALAPFDDFFSFQEGVLVVSTAALNDFAFPDTSVFDNSAITSPQIRLPTAQGVVAGMNTYASIDLGGQKELSLLQNFLSLPATLDVTVQIGLDDVTTGSALYVSVSGDINSSTSLTGNFGAKLIGGVLELYMTGIVTSIIQGQTTVFDFTLAFVENGAFLSGGYQGTIDFVIVEISNLVIEIGIDWEGVPTLGFGAQIDVEDFNTSVMILLDSAVPTQSMFVASISNRTLATVLQSLCNLTDTSGVPESIMGVLAAVGLSGTNYFTIDDTADTLAASLNSRDVAAISAAFAMDGTWLSTDSQEVIVSVADEGTLWYVTDMVNVLHYQLTKSGAGAAIQVSLNAQFYVVPQTTQLGSITVEQGFRINGTLHLFGFKASLTVQIEDAKGLWIDCAYSPMIIAVSGYQVLSIESDSGIGGPMLSVCTYENSAETDPDQQQPHFFATGAINVLGVASVGSVVDFTESGGAFSMTTSAGSGTFEMGGSFAGLTDCSITGTAEVDVDTTVDMGILGTIPVEAAVDYTYTITIDGAAASAGASGGFSFGGVGFSIPAFSLSLSEDSLIGLLSDAVDQVTSAIEAYLGDYQQWLNWLAAGVIQGIDSAEQVGEVLAKTFGVDYDTIATSTQQTLKYTTDQVASALEGAGASADDAASVLINTLGCSADAAADAVADVFTGEHCDVTITPHSDATITPHADSSSHGDVVTTPHSDTTITPHSDHKTHCDAGPFGSSKIHTDIHSSHSDIPKVHADLGKNHGDIPATHDDISAVHTDVET